jgi:copper chaperone CopZ
MTLRDLTDENGRAVVLSIAAMTCGGCASTVTRVLSRVPGVTGAKVDLASRRATVLGTARPEELIAAVEAAGYGAELSDDTSTSGERNEHGRSGGCC